MCQPDAGGWPRAAVFAIALRDPVPFADGTTFTWQLASPSARVNGPTVSLQCLDGTLVEVGPQSTVVSLTVSQLHRRAPDETHSLVDDAMLVLTSSAAGVAHSDPDRPTTETLRTIVAATTLVESEWDFLSRERADAGYPDVVGRCLDLLYRQVRAVRLVEQSAIPELTYERIVPVIPYLWREARSGRAIGEPGLLVLDHANIHEGRPTQFSPEAMDQYTQQLERLNVGDTLALYRERRLEARLALSRDGQPAEAAVQAAIAAEVLLDGVLGMILFEDKILGREQSNEPAVAAFSTNLSRRIRGCFHPRLGGRWTFSTGGPIAAWNEATAGLRNRVVHRGYRPTRDEAEASVRALNELEGFVCNRLADRSSTYPRSALAVLGRRGLESRGHWHRSRFSTESIGPVMDFLSSYRAWRDLIDEEVEALGRSR